MERLWFSSFTRPTSAFAKIILLVVLSFFTSALTGQLAPQRELGPALIVPEPPGAALPISDISPRAPYTSPTWFDTSSRSAVKTAYDTILAPTVPTAVWGAARSQQPRHHSVVPQSSRVACPPSAACPPAVRALRDTRRNIQITKYVQVAFR